VVVGDHEQVSPDAVGEKLEEVDRLIDQYLDQIPNAKLYVGATSIYDLARQSFPGQLRLVEHFRCVPEIIEFSNRLSYNGEVRPLRESASALAPHLIEHCVVGSRGAEKLNQAEARAVVTLIAAAIEQPQYRNKSIGVVSLLGEEQAGLVDEELRRRLAPVELQRRNVVCGNAAQFQGDERDVMFLTMVDAPQGGPLPLRARDQFKQRYNVAASRARDQMWLIHSLDPGRDLKPDDLRYLLIQHVRNPGLLASEEAKALARVESPFEAEVVRRLVNAGFRVRTQVPVGAYRIDIVVQGQDRRLAIECDGERSHPRSALERDLGRQAVLERLGWRFYRIRGSRFFRDPEETMSSVFRSLEERGIPPLGPDDGAGDGMAACNALIDRVRTRAAELAAEWYPAFPLAGT
jgi:very-short-patch-repair endonuclease